MLEGCQTPIIFGMIVLQHYMIVLQHYIPPLGSCTVHPHYLTAQHSTAQHSTAHTHTHTHTHRHTHTHTHTHTCMHTPHLMLPQCTSCYARPPHEHTYLSINSLSLRLNWYTISCVWYSLISNSAFTHLPLLTALAPFVSNTSDGGDPV